MQAEMLLYPLFIKEAKGVVFCCVPDFELNFRAESISAAIKKARKLIGADLCLADVSKQEYSAPSDIKTARKKAGMLSPVDYSDAPAVLIDIDFKLYMEKKKNRPVIRKCRIPYWMDRKIDELEIDCSQLLENAVRNRLNERSRIDTVSSLVGKDVHVEAWHGEYFGRIVDLTCEGIDGAQYDTLKLDTGNGVYKHIRLYMIENIEPCNIVFDITGTYHADNTGGVISYKGSINWCGDIADIYLGYLPADEDPLEKAFAVLHKLYDDLYGWDKKLKSYAANTMAGDGNRILLISSPDEKVVALKYITKDEFKRRMKLSFLNVSPNGDLHFDFSFDGNVTAQVIEMEANVFSRKVLSCRYRRNTDE